MHRVYLGLGSNIDPHYHIQCGVAQLRRLFGSVGLSSVYHSPAVGFDGAAFLNMVARVDTDRSLAWLVLTLRALEYAYGRKADSVKFSSRSLDIDILTFDNRRGVYDNITLPRPDILENAYVLCPFAELAPDLILPDQSLTLAQLWACYGNVQQITKLGGCDELAAASNHYCEAH